MVKIKICGMTSVADARVAAEAGADAIGLNFFAGSPRRIDDATAEAIVRSLPVSIAAVGVFVDDMAATIRGRAARLKLRGVQTYGADCVGESFHPQVHWPAFRIRNAGDVECLRALLKAGPHTPEAVLVDSHT